MSVQLRVLIPVKQDSTQFCSSIQLLTVRKRLSYVLALLNKILTLKLCFFSSLKHVGCPGGTLLTFDVELGALLHEWNESNSRAFRLCAVLHEATRWRQRASLSKLLFSAETGVLWCSLIMQVQRSPKIPKAQ